MKAKTKSARLAQKRGRKRKEGPREPSGRISRSGVAHEAADKAPLEARAVRLGIAPSQARDQKAGTFIGYLNLIGPRDGLSDDQYQGAQSYLRLREAHLRALQAPGAIYDTEAIAGVSGDPDAYAAWVKRVESEYKTVRAAIQEAQNASRENLWAALDLVVIEGKAMHHMIGATRLLCNVFARVFGSGAQKKHAA